MDAVRVLTFMIPRGLGWGVALVVRMAVSLAGGRGGIAEAGTEGRK